MAATRGEGVAETMAKRMSRLTNDTFTARWNFIFTIQEARTTLTPKLSHLKNDRKFIYKFHCSQHKPNDAKGQIISNVEALKIRDGHPVDAAG